MKKNLKNWQAAKIPGFLVVHERGEIVTFDKDEANELFEDLTPYNFALYMFTGFARSHLKKPEQLKQLRPCRYIQNVF